MFVVVYCVKYDRVDPETGKPITSGTEKTTYSHTDKITLMGLAVGATYRIKVSVNITGYGASVFSDDIISSTLTNKTEIEKFRDSLNLGSIESNIKELSSRPR